MLTFGGASHEIVKIGGLCYDQGNLEYKCGQAAPNPAAIFRSIQRRSLPKQRDRARAGASEEAAIHAAAGRGAESNRDGGRTCQKTQGTGSAA